MSEQCKEENTELGSLRCKVVPQTDEAYSAVILFLHGSGNTGENLVSELKQILGDDIAFQHVKMIFPTAPARPYTLLDGQPSTVWFDRIEMSPDVSEHQSVDEMCKILSHLIEEEVLKGTPKHRIIIGGYSMGGAMALALAYKYHTDVAGVFALSSFLSRSSSVYEVLKQKMDSENLPPLFYCHGVRDDLTLFGWAEETFKILSSLGVKGEFHRLDIEHELIKEEIHMLREWILTKVAS